eukprot:Lankesteria_metandrocarpae@DN522_c0_g1_i1.p1
MAVAVQACAPQVDPSSLDYMAGMLWEEVSSSLAPLSSEEVYNLIGPFLVDGGVSENDVESVCDNISKQITKKESPKKNTSKPTTDVQKGAAKKVMAIGAMAKEVTAEGFVDPFLGLSGNARANYNSHIPIAEAIKQHKALQKEREKQLRLLNEWNKEKLPLPPPGRRHGDKQLQKVTDVVVESFSVAVAGRELLKDALLKLSLGQKYGLIGRNGIGKSTFIAALVRREIHGIHNDLSIGCVEQEIPPTDECAIDKVLEVDTERTELLAEASRIEANADAPESTKSKADHDKFEKRLVWIYNRLQAIDASQAESTVCAILGGLGFTDERMRQATKALSGGWRMRVALARALFADSDILCLDEPTNHLDLHAVAWLAAYLNKSPKTCIIVSHARHFLDDVCTDIVEFKNQTLKYFRGDYSNFEIVKAEQERVHQRQFEAQKAKKEHVQSFIDRFRYNAKRAALVQSRIKHLEKLPMLEAIANEPSLQFIFSEPDDIPQPFLQFREVGFAYGDNPKSSDFLLRDVDMSVDSDSRIAVCGVNGSGKSTLLKIMTGDLEPVDGVVTRTGRLKVGFFSQHHVEGLDLTLNSVQQLIERYPNANLKPEDARSFLGKFGISGLMALEPLYILSGGQKSRVAFAVMAFHNPHLLILDEPTNHLDLDTIQALIKGLSEFKGGVVLVSHDAHLVSCVVDEVWHVDEKSRTCTKFGHDFDEYKTHLLRS